MTVRPGAARRRLRVLVVEDREADAELVVARLRDAGNDVEWERVQTAEAMRAALAREAWDAILSDFQMPSFDAFGALRVAAKSGLDLPFIVVSGTIGEDTAVEAMRAGAHDYFLKGQLTRLPAAIEREIEEAGHRRSERRMARALAALNDVAYAAGGPPDVKRLARFAADRARELLGSDVVATIYWWDEQEAALRLLAEGDDGLGPRVTSIPPGVGAVGEAFVRREPVTIDHAHPPEGFRPAAPGLTGRSLAVPLVAGDRALGAFLVRAIHPGPPFGDDDTRILTLLAAQVAPAIESARLFEELRHRASHDPLTGLPNRVALLEALGSVLRAGAGRAACALLLADLDSFKAINEALGREAGDEILRQTAARLRDGAGEIGFAAHLGADEFALMLRSRGATAAERTAARMLRGLDRPFSVQGQSVAAAASIGIAVSPDHGTDAELLLRRAEIAMHSAKRSGSTFAMYSPSLEEHTAERLGLVGQLRGAIERDELVLHYQRQVELTSMRTIGYEALVRWQHPERGLLSPAMFVPLAERLGLSRVLFEWSLRTALSEGGALGVDSGIVLALNLSVRNLLDADLPGLVEKALRDAGREPGSLCLEVTEQGVMAEPERAIKVLERLRAIGLKVSIDDFGTGYSSMAYLQRLPADELKIDRTFLRDIPNDRRNVAIVRATIDLARGLGIAALAEGVEDEGTLAALVTLGCDRAQGFHLGRPAPAPALDRAGTA
jgi:diguanylate cyclase (GGDEF)-like protein